MNMSTELWKVGIWIVATVGVAGTITLFVLYPMIMGGIFRGIAKLLGFVLNYRIGCALVAAIVVGFAVDYARHSHDDAIYAARVEAFNQAQDARDAKIRTDTRELVTQEIAEAAISNTATDKDVKGFHDERPAVVPEAGKPETGNPYRVGADACRLRRIAGQAGCGPVGAKGVPKAHPAAKPASHWGGFRLPGFGSAGARPAQ